MTRVWVTRDEGEDGPLATALRVAGLVPIVEPVLRVCVTGDARESVSRLGPDDWLVLTSRRAIDAIALEPARVPQVAVVGRRSADRARERGMRVELVSPSGDAAGLWPVIAERARGRRVCFPRSALASVPHPSAISALRDVELEAPVIYEVEPREVDESVMDRIDIAAFTSASAVEAVHAALGRLPAHSASIGPRTSEAMLRLGAEPGGPEIEAPEPTFESLAGAIASAAGRHGKP